MKSIRPFLTEGTLVVFDFDGTLAPIVKRHHAATLPESTSRLLVRLAKVAPVALLSGRGLHDLKARSPIPLLAWVGNHGMEGLPGNAAVAARAKKTVNVWHQALAPELEDLPGVSLENKDYSLTVHYRESRRPELARKKIRALVAKLEPRPEVLPGKCVVNLLTAENIKKGEAVRRLLDIHGFERAIFVGDDDTDEDVFRLKDRRIFSVRVGHAPGSKAKVYIRNQKEANALLALLLQRGDD